MFNSTSLRNPVIVTAALMLAVNGRCAGENEQSVLKMEFVRIPAGNFYMGSPSSERDRDNDEGPVHEVRVTRPFYMGKYEVTQAQWKAVMGTTLGQQRNEANSPWLLKGEGPEHPIYYVSWEEAVEFCKRLGREFRLPTEAEWEYACRAGSQARFCYGDDPNCSELGQYAWYYGNSNNETHPVGQKKPNTWGLYDMHGNVDEWCSDPYEFLHNYEDAGSVDSTRPASAKDRLRIFRGGSWLDKPRRCRSANREGFTQSAGCDIIGFRVVYTVRARDDKEVLEIALPERPANAATISNKRFENRFQTIAGVVRDESGVPIDDIHIHIIPAEGYILRDYAQGRFEICLRPSDPNTQMQGYHLLAQNERRNLAVGVEIEADAKTLDVKLKSGIILTGKVVDPDGKGIGEARVVIRLQMSDWGGGYLAWGKADGEGRFEFGALPPAYHYALSASKMHYLVGRAEIHPEDVRDNRVDGVSIVLPRGPFSVSGVVVDANGKPVPNVWVYCTGKGQAGINSHTDAEGCFKADGIFEGHVDIMASIRGNDGRWLGGNVSVQAGATDVRIVLHRNGTPPPKGRTCFPAGTDVWVNGALVEISRVAPGQTVGKTDCAEQKAFFGQIEKIEQHAGIFTCRDIVLENGNRVSVVDAHCFMLDSGKWLAAQDLKDGLRLRTSNGTVAIKTVATRTTPFVGEVYNLKIRNSDCYAVGQDGLIVRDY